jgi:hypothetical protein
MPSVPPGTIVPIIRRMPWKSEKWKAATRGPSRVSFRNSSFGTRKRWPSLPAYLGFFGLPFERVACARRSSASSLIFSWK